MHSLKFLEVKRPRSMGWSQGISRTDFFWRLWGESASCLFQVLKVAYYLDLWILSNTISTACLAHATSPIHALILLHHCLRTLVISESHWIVQDNLSISKSLITLVKLLLPCKITIHTSWELGHGHPCSMQVSLCSREQDGPWQGIWQTLSSSIHDKFLQSSIDRLIFSCRWILTN